MGLKPCLERGCGRLSPASRCPDHTRQRQRNRDATRAHDPIRVFRRSAAWTNCARRFRAAHPDACVLCGTNQDLTVGHIIPLIECLGSGLELDWSNLRVECAPCQNKQGHQQRRRSF
jgi:5-methylcytosine-specific restriction endonuclease McrA